MRSKFNLKNYKYSDPEPLPDVLQNALFNDDYILSQSEVQILDGINDTLKAWIEIFAETRVQFEARGGTVELMADKATFKLKDQVMTLTKDGVFKPEYKIGRYDIDRRLIKMRMIAEFYEPTIRNRIKNIKELTDIVTHVHTSRGAWRVVNASIEHAENLEELSRGTLMWDDFVGLFNDKE